MKKVLLGLALCTVTATGAFAGTAALGSGQTLTSSASQCELPDGTWCGLAVTSGTGGYQSPIATQFVIKCQGHNPVRSCPSGFTRTNISNYGNVVNYSNSSFVQSTSTQMLFTCLHASELEGTNAVFANPNGSDIGPVYTLGNAFNTPDDSGLKKLTTQPNKAYTSRAGITSYTQAPAEHESPN